MSEKIPDKNTYSVDEMMERLRDGEREKQSESELVTREDGTQVMRVKKRKRRSKQKKVEEAKRRKKLVLLRTLGLITLPLFLGLGVVYLLAKYNSPSFNESVLASLWEKTGARAKINTPQPMGTRLSADTVHLNWPDGSHLDQFEASKLQGDLSLYSFLTGRFKGTELKAGKGYLITSGRENRKVSKPKGEAGDFAGFERYTSDHFSFYFGRKESSFRLEDTRVRFAPTDYSQQLFLTGGQLSAGSWGLVPLKRGTLEFLNDNIKVVSLRFEEEERNLIISGDLNLKDSIHSLTVEVAEGTVENVAGFGHGNLFVSDIEGATGTLVFRPWSYETHEVTMNCTPEYIKVRNFPFQAELERLYGDDKFKEFEFEVEDDFEIIRKTNDSEIRNLDLVELGVLAIKGNVKVSDDKLSGSLFVGLPDHKKLTLRAEQVKALFARGKLEDGFFWFEVELSGTPNEPKDNFRQYFDDGRAPQTTDELFEQLTQ